VFILLLLYLTFTAYDILTMMLDVG